MPSATDEVGRIDMIGLTYGEHLMIWGLRRVVTGQGADDLFIDECRYAFGGDAGDAVGHFCVFLSLLGRAARKAVEIAPPGALVLMRDERCILTLLAAAQADDERGGQAVLEAHLRWFATPAHRPALAQTTVLLARLLAAHGHRFSLAYAGMTPATPFETETSLCRPSDALFCASDAHGPTPAPVLENHAS